MFKFKNGEEFEGGLNEKRKRKWGKRRKKKRGIKHALNTFMKRLNDRKKSQKQGRILEGGGIFWLARIYIFGITLSLLLSLTVF